LKLFSKRAGQVETALDAGVARFVQREGREPDRAERARLERDAEANSRNRKTRTKSDSFKQWREEAAAIGVTAESLSASIDTAGRSPQTSHATSVDDVLSGLASSRSTWHRMDVVRAVCDQATPDRAVDGEGWVAMIDNIVDKAVANWVNLDPDAIRAGTRTSEAGPGEAPGVSPETNSRRVSDRRSVWVEPVASNLTSQQVGRKFPTDPFRVGWESLVQRTLLSRPTERQYDFRRSAQHLLQYLIARMNRANSDALRSGSVSQSVPMVGSVP
jgi:hypothetical protein